MDGAVKFKYSEHDRVSVIFRNAGEYIALNGPFPIPKTAMRHFINQSKHQSISIFDMNTLRWEFYT